MQYNMKIAGLNGYMCGFSVHCNTVYISVIWDIRMYLMKKHDMICLDLLKTCLLDYYTFAQQDVFVDH